MKSDTTVPDALAQSLREHVRQLEDVPDAKKDWHPKSDDKVLDLLHPSLFPLTYHLTRVLPRGTVSLKDCATYTGMGEVVRGEVLYALGFKAYVLFLWTIPTCYVSIEISLQWHFNSEYRVISPET